MTLHTEILSIETSDFLKQIIFLKSLNSVFIVFPISFQDDLKRLQKGLTLKEKNSLLEE